MIPPHLSMMGEEFCCCDSSSESECGYLELQSKRLHEFEQGVDFGRCFEGFDACNGGALPPYYISPYFEEDLIR